jgi:hypothetical protein
MITGYEPKNKIEPFIVKNFFSEEEVAMLRAHIEDFRVREHTNPFYAPLLLEDMSRMQIELIYPPMLRERLERFASETVGEHVMMSHNSYLDYYGKYNVKTNPKLPPHVDSDNYYSKLTIDYLLSKTIDWPIVIEGKPFNLEVGDLFIFWGAGQIHWRDPIALAESDRVEVLTMHFSKFDDFMSLDKSSREEETRTERRNAWKAVPRMQEYMKDYFNRQELIQLKKKAAYRLLPIGNKNNE